MTFVVERGAVGRVRMDRPEVFNAFDRVRVAPLHGAFVAWFEKALVLLKRAAAWVSNP